MPPSLDTIWSGCLCAALQEWCASRGVKHGVARVVSSKTSLLLVPLVIARDLRSSLARICFPSCKREVKGESTQTGTLQPLEDAPLARGPLASSFRVRTMSKPYPHTVMDPSYAGICGIEILSIISIDHCIWTN